MTKKMLGKLLSFLCGVPIITLKEISRNMHLNWEGQISRSWVNNDIIIICLVESEHCSRKAQRWALYIEMSVYDQMSPACKITPCWEPLCFAFSQIYFSLFSFNLWESFFIFSENVCLLDKIYLPGRTIPAYFCYDQFMASCLLRFCVWFQYSLSCASCMWCWKPS